MEEAKPYMPKAARENAQNAQLVQEIVLSVVPKHKAFQLFLWMSKQWTVGLLKKDSHQPHWYMVWFLNLRLFICRTIYFLCVYVVKTLKWLWFSLGTKNICLSKISALKWVCWLLTRTLSSWHCRPFHLLKSAAKSYEYNMTCVIKCMGYLYEMMI